MFFDESLWFVFRKFQIQNRFLKIVFENIQMQSRWKMASFLKRN